MAKVTVLRRQTATYKTKEFVDTNFKMCGDENSKSWNKNLIDSLAIEDFAAKMKLIQCSEGESAVTKHTGVIWNAN